jgi:hypothetical protein
MCFAPMFVAPLSFMSHQVSLAGPTFLFSHFHTFPHPSMRMKLRPSLPFHLHCQNPLAPLTQRTILPTHSSALNSRFFKTFSVHTETRAPTARKMGNHLHAVTSVLAVVSASIVQAISWRTDEHILISSVRPIRSAYTFH